MVVTRAGIVMLGAAECLLLAVPAHACEGVYDRFNDPLVTHADCSFENADGEAGRWGRDVLSGGKAFDRGNGRVAQKILIEAGCQHDEALVFTECETGASIAINGSLPPDYWDTPQIAGFIESYVKYIQPPYGSIRADSNDTVASLAEQATKEGYGHFIRDEAGGKGAYWTGYKSNCGCALFYPGTKAAQMNWARD